MAGKNESIEQLTESLQELTTTKTYGHTCEAVVPREVPVSELQVSDEVEAFVTKTRAYSTKTRNVSVGTY